MRRFKRFWLIFAAVVLIGGGVVVADWWKALPPNQVKTYTGSNRCVECHQDQAKSWKGSDHDLAMDLATPDTVLGNFDDATFTYHGMESRFYRRGDKFYVYTDGPDGKHAEFEIKYVFGVRPLQQYMVAFPDGRVQVLPFAWDVNAKRWYHLYQGSPHRQGHDETNEDEPAILAGSWLHWTGAGQNWNYMCADCHSTNLQKKFDLKNNRYHTSYSEIDVSCEACHGPGSLHVTLAEDRWLFWDRHHGYGLPKLKSPSSQTQIETCAPCHSRRHVVYPGFQAGNRYMDHYALTLLEDGLYYPDGQIHDEVYVTGSFLQSLMYRKGVRCTDCHDPHTAKLRAQGNNLCVRCHTPAKYDAPSHHHHAAGSAGAQCVECHMPARNYMVVDGRRDHSIRVPRPDVSLDLGTPNACANCHVDRSKSDKWKSYPAWLDAANAGDPVAAEEIRRVNKWSAAWIERWFPDSKHRPRHFGYVLDAARRGTLERDGQGQSSNQQSAGNAAVPSNSPRTQPEEQAAIAGELATLARDRNNVGPIVRATAVSLLERYPTVQAMVANDEALKDEEPMVRLAAVRNLDAFFPFRATELWSITTMSPQQRANLRQQFNELKQRAVPALRDPLRAVRIEAARVMSVVPRMYLEDDEAAAFDAALAEFFTGQNELADQAGAHLTMGAVYGNLGQLPKAIEEYQTAIRIDPEFVPARINLALLYNYQGKNAEAERLLREAIRYAPELTDAHYYLGLLLAEDADRLAESAESLAAAVKYSPQHTRIRYNYALALQQLGKLEEAAAQLTQALEQDPTDIDLHQALIALYAQQQRWDEAIRRAEQLVNQFPHVPDFQQQLQLLRQQQQRTPGAGPQPRQ